MNRSFQLFICFVFISFYAPLSILAYVDPHGYCGFLIASRRKSADWRGDERQTRMNTGESAKVDFYNRGRFTGGTYRMATTVWVYPEREYEQLGAVRYELAWEEVKPSAKGKEDIDPDIDIIYRALAFKTKEDAIKKGRALVDGYKTAYGQATVTRQIVDWFVEENRVAEWANTSEVEYVD